MWIPSVRPSAAWKKLSSLGKGATSAATTQSQNLTGKALGVAVSQVISALRYASQKIVEADEDLPEGTILRVSANALLVELSLEVPVKEIIQKNMPPQDI